MKKTILILSIAFSMILLISCGNDKKDAQDSGVEKQEMKLLGAGATFPYPLYSKLFDAYHQLYSVKVNYQAIGSGGGIRQMLNKTVDFGGTDAFMNEEELQKVNNSIVHIPTCLGADVISYNLPGNPQLKLTPDVIADIFLGKIHKWNNSRIKEFNPNVNLPDQKIVVVHRSDGSGTTFIFSDYLSKVSKDWEKRVGRGKSLNWPIGLGAKGNQGVSGQIRQLPGSIGYIELTYAVTNNMPVAEIRNKANNFIKPSLESVSLAANVDLPPDTRVSITDTDSPDGYPISSFTWLILYKDLKENVKDEEHAKTLVNMVWWMIHDGQKYTKPLHYAPLPEAAINVNEMNLKEITFNGKKLLSK